MPGALDGGALHGAEQIGRVQPGEPALAAADRAAHRGDDEDFLHGAGVSHRTVRRVKPCRCPSLTCPAATFDGYAMRLASLALLLLVGLPIRAGAQGVTARLENSLTKVQDALGETFARALPLPSASAGVSYAFDPATGNFQRESSTFGQVYLDRADTLGARRVNLSVRIPVRPARGARREVRGRPARPDADLPSRQGRGDRVLAPARRRQRALVPLRRHVRHHRRSRGEHRGADRVQPPHRGRQPARRGPTRCRSVAVHAARRGRRYDAGGRCRRHLPAGEVSCGRHRPDPRRGRPAASPALGKPGEPSGHRLLRGDAAP